MQSQNQAVLKHLQSGRAIEPSTALEKFGIMRLGARIWDLRRQGHLITSTLVQVHTRFGKKARVSIYKMEGI